jgi:hypothetical protein
LPPLWRARPSCRACWRWVPSCCTPWGRFGPPGSSTRLRYRCAPASDSCRSSSMSPTAFAAVADPRLLLLICPIGILATLLAALALSHRSSSGRSQSTALSPPASGGASSKAQERNAAATASPSGPRPVWRGHSLKYKAAFIAVPVVICLMGATLVAWSIAAIALAAVVLLVAIVAVLVLVGKASPSRRRGAAITALVTVAALRWLAFAAFLFAYPPPCAELRLADGRLLRGVHITTANGFHYVKSADNKPVRGIAADSIVRMRMREVRFPERPSVMEEVLDEPPFGIRAIGVTEDEDADRPAFEDCIDDS